LSLIRWAAPGCTPAEKGVRTEKKEIKVKYDLNLREYIQPVEHHGTPIRGMIFLPIRMGIVITITPQNHHCTSNPNPNDKQSNEVDRRGAFKRSQER
jgi:hypothetical protein